MIQRIQTLYLLGVVLLWGILPFSSLASLITSSEELILSSWGIYAGEEVGRFLYPLLGLLFVEVLITCIALITIFLFKKRMLQIRLSVFNGCLMVGFYLMFAFFAWMGMKEYNASLHISFPLSFPLIAFILNYLAIRGIAADEALVRSLDRIR